MNEFELLDIMQILLSLKRKKGISKKDILTFWGDLIIECRFNALKDVMIDSLLLLSSGGEISSRKKIENQISSVSRKQISQQVSEFAHKYFEVVPDDPLIREIKKLLKSHQ